MAAKKKNRLSREEKSEATRRSLIRAAANVVGEHGYSGASIARITTAANVAQGSIYYYFESRDDLFAHLLPEVGRMMIESIATHIRAEDDLAEKERARFRGYLLFLQSNPGFYRVLQEAEVFAPAAFREHMANMVTGYCRALKHDIKAANMPVPSQAELESTVYMLLGARNYVAMVFFGQSAESEPNIEKVVKAYMRLIGGRLFPAAEPAPDH